MAPAFASNIIDLPWDSAKKVAGTADITETFIECAWGDPLGVEFQGMSLPDAPSPEKLADEEEDFARWQWLFDDPLFELDKLTIRDTARTHATVPVPGTKPDWLTLWDQICTYRAQEGPYPRPSGTRLCALGR